MKSDLYMYLPGNNMPSGKRYISNKNLVRLTLLKGDCSHIRGWYKHNIYGDCSNISGNIENLIGDVSGLRGDVTNLKGNCTGLSFDCTNYSGDIQKAYARYQSDKGRHRLFLGKTKFLTDEDNERLWDVWLKIATCTIGLNREEYERIRNPKKNKPPFPVDKWGRYYVEDEQGIVVFSINPADILFLRTNQEKQSCWSLYDKNNGKLRMRLLIALNAINPTVGCCFRINYIDKFNILNGLPFKYYKVSDGTFFQYQDGKLQRFGYNGIRLGDFFDTCYGDVKITPALYGHDGYFNVGHDRQKELLFYEKYIKDDFSLYKGVRPEGTKHVLANFEGGVCLDENFNVLHTDFNEDFTKARVRQFMELFILWRVL